MKNNTLAQLKLAISFFMISILWGCIKQNDVTVIKLAHALPESHPVHKGIVFMAAKVAEKSKGRMQVDIYPSCQLGDERELIELLQIGSLAMTKVSTAPLEGFVPAMKVLGIPYIFRDDKHRWDVLNSSIGKDILKAGEPFFIKGLCYYDAGSRSFYTKNKPITAPEDLRGLKIRVTQSITSMQMIQSLGGSSTPIPYGELYTAIQQGVVDGAENNPPSFYTSKHFEVCKHYSIDEHTAVPDILVISMHVWKGLTAEERQWLQEAVDESVPYQREVWKQASDEALHEVQKAGVTVSYPDKKKFKEAVEGMYESFRGSNIYDLIHVITSYQ